jgi:hypothetical protein
MTLCELLRVCKVESNMLGSLWALNRVGLLGRAVACLVLLFRIVKEPRCVLLRRPMSLNANFSLFSQDFFLQMQEQYLKIGLSSFIPLTF